MKHTLLIIILFSATTNLWAQDSVLINGNLTEVEIVEKRPTLQDLYIFGLTSSYTLAELIDENSGNLTKFNGPIGVATANFGGLGGQHAAIIWKGFNLQSTMNSFADMNLIPAFLFDNAAFGTDFGSQPLGGGLGGVVQLNSIKAKNEVMLNYGSFKNYAIGVALSPINKHKFKYTTKVYAASGANNFKYNSPTGERRLPNALFRQVHFQNSLSYLLNKKTQLMLDHWSLAAHRQIPPTLFEQNKTAYQNDVNHRITASLLHKHDEDNRQRTLMVKAGYFNEHIGFIDSVSNINGDNNAQSLISSAKHSWNKTNYVNDVSTSFILGANAGLHWVQTRDYNQLSNYQYPFRNAAISARFQQKGFAQKWLYALGLKTENFMERTAYGFDAVGKYRVNEKLNVSLFGGKTYKFPTFNDLFWLPGGNNNLVPEEAYKGHLQLEWMPEIKVVNLKFWLQAHSAYVENWIMWLPNSRGIWQAENVKTVWSRGLDFKYSLTKFYRWKYLIKFSGNYAYTRTENLGNSPFVNEGTQLSYVPFHKTNQFLSITRHNTSIRWHYQMVGKRFTNADNSEQLPAYHLNHLRLNYRKQLFNFSFQVNNLFNVDYQSTLVHPMPWRNFSITVNYNLKKLTK